MQQIKRTTLLDVAVEGLRDAIINGEVELGERVNESTFTAKLGISRTTFREALRQMEQAGLLVRDPFRGTFVREFSEEEILELNELRGVLETYAIELIIRKGDNCTEKLLPLYGIVSQMEGIDPEADAAPTNALHITFHRTLLEMAGSKLLFNVGNELSQQFWVAMRISQLAFIAQGESDNFAEAHREIVDAIIGGDMDVVRRVIHNHVSHSFGSYNTERSIP